MTMKRKSLLFAAGVLLLAMVLVPSVAVANNGVHGGYMPTTDACAGCHRAHTAPSSATWTYSGPGGTSTGSALLLGNTAELYLFCLTCHGASGQGADTNVEEGVYEGALPGGYGTAGSPLISGPFGVPTGEIETSTGDPIARDKWGNKVTSKHEFAGGGWAAWGGGLYGRTATSTPVFEGSDLPSMGVGAQRIKMECSTCHDVHGSSNYRLLKDKVYGVTVGGYDSLGNPTPYVLSAEIGFPAGGFRLHTMNNEYAPAYQPNYTEARYAQPPTSTTSPIVGAPDQRKGMSGWCAGCHTYYVGIGTTVTPGLPNNESRTTTYTAEEGNLFGNVLRHRHPVNVPLTNFKPTSLEATQSAPYTAQLPLAHKFSERNNTTLVKTTDEFVDCLTCHYAHGTTATMSGYANVADPRNPDPGSGDGGVAPTDDSALLRFNNRYVCEACHNK
jgi:predicted CXXCH cytochrome family protein